MKQFLVTSLILVSLIVAAGILVFRATGQKDVKFHVKAVGFLAAIAVLQVLSYLPYETVAQQPAGKLVGVQLGTGSTVLVETDSAFYTVRGGFSAQRGERLELRVRQHPVAKATERYLCSAAGCAELSGYR